VHATAALVPAVDGAAGLGLGSLAGQSAMKLADAHSSIQIRLEVHRMDNIWGVVKDDEPWLDVSVQAQTPAGSWTCQETCLQVGEAQLIAKWFRALARGEATHRTLWFVEQTLIFEFVGREGSKLHLLIFLADTCRPPWLGDTESDAPAIDLRIGRNTLLAAADDLDIEIRLLGLDEGAVRGNAQPGPATLGHRRRARRGSRP
jgi:hypothetical protein